MAALETPMGLALVVCDTIIEDKQTGKKTLIGLFDRLYARSFPCVHPSMAVFVCLTSGRGKYPCEVVCRHDDGQRTAFSARGTIVMREPSQVVDLVFRLNGVRFPEAGKYSLQFLADEIPIMMRPLVIQPRPQKGSGPATPPADPQES